MAQLDNTLVNFKHKGLHEAVVIETFKILAPMDEEEMCPGYIPARALLDRFCESIIHIDFQRDRVEALCWNQYRRLIRTVSELHEEVQSMKKEISMNLSMIEDHTKYDLVLEVEPVKSNSIHKHTIQALFDECA